MFFNSNSKTDINKLKSSLSDDKKNEIFKNVHNGIIKLWCDHSSKLTSENCVVYAMSLYNTKEEIGYAIFCSLLIYEDFVMRLQKQIQEAEQCPMEIN